MDLINQ
jgi:hypothetical protein